MRGVNSLLVLLVAAGSSIVEASFGIHKTREGCASDHAAHDEKYLSGEWQPFFTTGPPPECDAEGCLDGFWAPMSRFQVEPTCPKQLVAELTSNLRRLHREGSWWATKALTLQPCDLWEVLKFRTTWVVGDSVTEDLGHAMAQLMLEYWDKQNWNESVAEDPTMAAALNHGALEGAHTMHKRVPYWCFVMGSSEERGRICYVKADRGHRSQHVMNLMPRLAGKDDVVLVNLGIHYNNMWDLQEDVTMMSTTLTQPGMPKNVFWVESGPQHYETETGMFNMTRPIQEQFCKPAGSYHNTELITFADGTLGVKPGSKYSDVDVREIPNLHRLIAGGERNLASQPIIDSIGIPTLRLWNITLPLHQFHTHVHGPNGVGECSVVACDCTHSCHPSWSQLILVHFIDLVEKHAAKQHHRVHSTQRL